MSDTQHNHIPEVLQPSEPSMPDLTPDNMSTTEALIPSDATTEALLAGYTDKDLTKSTPLSSVSSHGHKAVVEAHQQLHLDASVNKQHAGDPENELHSSEITFRYVVPEDIRPLDSYPRGYANLAATLDCEPNFSIYRKYGWLHNRVLLHLQAELKRLEQDLQFIDKLQAESRRFKEKIALQCDTDDRTGRKKVLAEIKTKLAEYDDLVFRLQKKNAMKRPTRRNQNSVMQCTCQNLVGMEASWTYRTDDLVALADDAAEQSWFHSVMHYARILAPRLFKGIFQSRERRIKSGSMPHLYIFSPIRIDAFYRAILTVIGTTLVLGPISVPSLLSRNPILTIYVFTLGFSIFCAVFTKASRDQVFAATGGYCALQVMVTLLSSRMK